MGVWLLGKGNRLLKGIARRLQIAQGGVQEKMLALERGSGAKSQRPSRAMPRKLNLTQSAVLREPVKQERVCRSEFERAHSGGGIQGRMDHSPEPGGEVSGEVAAAVCGVWGGRLGL